MSLQRTVVFYSWLYKILPIATEVDSSFGLFPTSTNYFIGICLQLTLQMPVSGLSANNNESWMIIQNLRQNPDFSPKSNRLVFRPRVQHFCY